MYPYFFETLGEIIDYRSGEKWSVLDLKREIIARIDYYHKMGISSGEKVIITHGNNARFFADLFALWHLNACAICVDDSLGITEFENIAKFCHTRFAICCGRVPDKLTDVDSNLTMFIDTLKVPLEGNVLNNKITIPFSVNIDEPALILFTSGTTGLPKGVVHSFRTLIAKWIILTQYVPLQHMDLSLCLLPTHFGHGLICNCLYPLLNKKKLLILPKFDLKVLVKLGDIIDEFEVTYMSSVPSLWKSVINLSSRPKKQTLKLITCGSSPLSADLWKQIQGWSGIERVWNTYGISETGSWIAGTSVDNVKPKDGLVGPGWGTRIVVTKNQEIREGNIDNILTQSSLPLGEVGYIWLQTPSLMQGYFNRPDLTESVICGTWFYTGDLGYITEEGLLVLVGRVRNEINSGGMKVIPEDIDFILERHEAIFESCTFGLSDEISGQIVATAIVFKKNIMKPSASELRQWSIKYLSDYKVPKIWYDLDAIPKSPSGKINRSIVTELCKNKSRMQ